MITYYFAPGACSIAGHICLEEAGAQYVPKALSFADGDLKKPEFLAINPAGQVPVLVVDGQPLTQNVAILTWIARTFPAARLLPEGSWNEAQALSFMAWLSSAVHISFHPQFQAIFTEDPAQRARMLAEARPVTEGYFERIEARLQGREWLFDHFTAADAYLVPFFDWAERLFQYDLCRFPNYRALVERVRARPAAQRAIRRETAGLAAA